VKDQIQKVKQVPAKEKVRMLAVRLTPEEQHRVKLAAVMAHTSICNLVRERLADVLVAKEVEQ